MIIGTHILFYSKDPGADRAFLRDVLGFRGIDIGHGWLIFAMPPMEAAVHPADDNIRGGVHAGHSMIGAVVYFMCDDVEAEIERLAAQGVACAPVQRADWGISTAIPLPSGGAVGLYQPLHPLAIVPARRKVRKSTSVARTKNGARAAATTRKARRRRTKGGKR